MSGIPAGQRAHGWSDRLANGRPWVLVHLPPPAADVSEAPVTVPRIPAPWLQALRHAQRMAVLEHGESSLNTPAEHLRARLMGLPADDGAIPFAALRARELGLDATQPWGFVHPCHWLPGAERTVIDDPARLQLDAACGQTLLAAMQPYFAEDGLTLVADAPVRWLVGGEPLRGLRTASLARVLGHDVARWPAQGACARLLRRLQSEMQMLLYQHPLHDERKAQGRLPVNSFWLDGVGSLPAGYVPPSLRLDEVLVHETGSAHSLLGGEPAPCNVALCGERAAALFALDGQPRTSLWQRLRLNLSAGSRTRELQALLQRL